MNGIKFQGRILPNSNSSFVECSGEERKKKKTNLKRMEGVRTPMFVFFLIYSECLVNDIFLLFLAGPVRDYNVVLRIKINMNMVPC